jgi:hypothetical protein
VTSRSRFLLLVVVGALLLVGSARASRALVLLGPDAGFFWFSRPVQWEYARCLVDPGAHWFEDGSAIC